MSSKLGVQNIAHTNGTNAMTIASDGSVSMTGHVLQVVSQTISGSLANISSTSYHSSGLTVSITPSSTNSKILLLFSSSIFNPASGFVNVSIHRNISSSTVGNTQVTGGTNLDTSTGNYGLSHGYSQTGSQIAPSAITILDNPSSTSTQTYTVTYKSSSGSSVNVVANGQIGSLIAQEIGG